MPLGVPGQALGIAVQKELGCPLVCSLSWTQRRQDLCHLGPALDALLWYSGLSIVSLRMGESSFFIINFPFFFFLIASHFHLGMEPGIFHISEKYASGQENYFWSKVPICKINKLIVNVKIKIKNLSLEIKSVSVS